MAEPEQRVAAVGVASVRLRLAQTAEHHGDYEDADIQVKDILRVDPANQVAIEFKMANDRLMDAARGTRPSPEALASLQSVLNSAEVTQTDQQVRILVELTPDVFKAGDNGKQH